MKATLDFSRTISPWTMDNSAYVEEVEKQILMDEYLVGFSEKDVWPKLQGLYALLFSKNQKDLANDLLTTFLDTVPSTKHLKIAPELEFIWHYAQARPQMPWETYEERQAAIATTAEIVAVAVKPEYNMGNAGFWRLGKNWTAMNEFSKYFDKEGRLRGICTTSKYEIETNPEKELQYWLPYYYQTLKLTYHPHEWRESSDVLTMAMCARLLCQAPKGEVPSQENVKEAFEALRKLFTNLGDGDVRCGLVDRDIYFLLALNLGERGAALDEVHRTFRNMIPGEYSAFFRLPAFHAMLSDTSQQPSSSKCIFDMEALEKTVHTIQNALTRRKAHGKSFDEYLELSWPELLRQFSEARFAILQSKIDDEEDGTGDECPESAADLLLPPLTAEEIADIDAKIGPIPEDLKEMSLVARGFEGGWHFGGGGFPGVQAMRMDTMEYAAEYLGYFDDDEDSFAANIIRGLSGSVTQETADGSVRQVTEYNIGFGRPSKSGDPVKCWTYFGTVQNDDILNFICPPSEWAVWRKGRVQPGEYCVFGGSHWTVETLDGRHSSMRHYFIDLLKQMKEELENPEREETSSDDEEEEESDEDEEGADEEELK